MRSETDESRISGPGRHGRRHGHPPGAGGTRSDGVEPFRGGLRALVALGAARAEEVGELFGLDVVISMLADDQAIRGVLLDSGALERARPGLIHLSMSTLSLDCVEALDQAHQRQGLAFVAAPVFGRTDVAEAGKLNIVVGGPRKPSSKSRRCWKLWDRRHGFSEKTRAGQWR